MCLEPHGLTVTEAAEGLGVSRQLLNNLVNEKSAMSADMAIRLAKRLRIGAETWLKMRLAFDLAHAYENAWSIHVTLFQAAPQSEIGSNGHRKVREKSRALFVPKRIEPMQLRNTAESFGTSTSACESTSITLPHQRRY
jgi:addiction module HigA family antidote